MKSATRSPLKGKSLRNPGQSVDEQRWELLYDKLLPAYLLALLLLILAGLEWWRFYHPVAHAPWTYTVLALIGIVYFGWQFWRVLPQFHRLRLASEGERVVGQYLEQLRAQGYQVFHDIIGEGFNVDHVLIGPAGIFTVETKTRSKPTRGSAKVVFDGEHILVNGIEPDRDPVVQAKAQAGWLRELLYQSTGKKMAVRPVVVFPGWFVEQSHGSIKKLWVLEPKALPVFLANEPDVLVPEDVKLASYHLSRFIRSNK